MKTAMVTLFLICSVLISRAQTVIQESAIGCWNMQKSMDITKSGELLQLKPDSIFAFVDYNAQLQDYEKLAGTWEQQAEKIILTVTDRPKQIFIMKKDKNGKPALTKDGGFYLVKADPEDCQ